MDKKNNIIDEVEEIRSRNNKNWMNLVRVAFKYAPKESAKIMQKIANCDNKINKLTRKLVEESKCGNKNETSNKI